MQRTLEKYLNQSLKNDRAVALLGPRQTGKSYLLGLLAQNEDIIVKLDDPAVRDQAKRDPVAYLRNRRKKTSRLFIDEPTKLPVIFDAIKVLIDECGLRPSGIALASSSNYLLMRRIKESLAGRTHI
ncbi:MAG: AAA family ATPase, partial [Elusimicrobia bacterium]|nr:AAA family ATPase [Elusimicrobiota bacterium]